MYLLMDQNESKLDHLESLGPGVDLVVGVLAKELGGVLVETCPGSRLGLEIGLHGFIFNTIRTMKISYEAGATKGVL